MAFSLIKNNIEIPTIITNGDVLTKIDFSNFRISSKRKI